MLVAQPITLDSEGLEIALSLLDESEQTGVKGRVFDNQSNLVRGDVGVLAYQMVGSTWERVAVSTVDEYGMYKVPGLPPVPTRLKFVDLVGEFDSGWFGGEDLGSADDVMVIEGAMTEADFVFP
jgi:hypothetical protein